MTNATDSTTSKRSWRIPDELWEQITPLLPKEHTHPKGGRPRVPARKCMEGIFYVMNSGCQWKSLPKRMGAGSTIHRRFQEWRAAGVFDKLRQEGIRFTTPQAP